MAWLFPTAPYGLGTSDIESLGSYLLRLSIIHATAPLVLLRLCLRQARLTAPPAWPLSPSLAVRPNSTTHVMARSIAEASGIPQADIGALTFLPLLHALDRSPETYSKEQRWCPECLAQQFADTGACYMKLSWHLKHYTHCEKHYLPLQDQCPACKAYQNTWKLRQNLYTCHHCGSPLGQIPENLETVEPWRFQHQDLVTMISYLARNRGTPLPEQGPRKFLQAVFDRAWRNDDEETVWARIPRDECLAYLYCAKPITLQTARRISHRLGVDLIDLLAGEATSTPRHIAQTWNLPLPTGLQRQQRRRLTNHAWLRKRLQDIVNAASSPSPSLKSIADDLHISTGGLWYHFPELCSIIVDRYKASMSAVRKNKYAQAETEINRLLREIKINQQPSLSKKEALRMLRESTGLPKHLLRNLIKNAFDNKF